MIWAEMAESSQGERFELLAEMLRQDGFANQFRSLNASSEDWQQVLHSAMGECSQIRVGAPFSRLILDSMTQLPALINGLGSCDVLARREGRWWPENLLYEAIQILFSREKAELDISSSALVVGSGAAASAAVAAAIRLGFSHINITDQFLPDPASLIRRLNEFYFNVHFQFTQPAELTALPGVHALVINATPWVETNEILPQLYYFNFLQSGALVVDLALAPTETQLLQEALDVGARVFDGVRLASYVDELWVKKMLSRRLNRATYEQRLRAALAAKTRP